MLEQEVELVQAVLVRVRRLLVLGVIGIGLLLVWARWSTDASGPVTVARSVRGAPEVPGPDAAKRLAGEGRTFALLISGGGRPRTNFQRSLLNIQKMVELLGKARVSEDRIAVFAGDGDDPALDVFVNEPAPEKDFWLIESTPLARILRTEPELVDSAVTGAKLFPATRAALSIWFLTARSQMKSGDTLLLYVTNHGRRPDQEVDGAVVLWGKGETFTPSDLGPLLDSLDPEVRIVLLMSQCYSGGFASLTVPHEGAPSRNACGYFSTTAERVAYSSNTLGYSPLFLATLENGGRFLAAQEAVWANDRFPNVPIRSSDVFLERVLAGLANTKKVPLSSVVDGLLDIDGPRAEPMVPSPEVVQKMTATFRLPPPHTLSEIETSLARLRALDDRFDVLLQAQKETLRELAVVNLVRFVQANPEWKMQLGEWVETSIPDGGAGDDLLAQGREGKPSLPPPRRRVVARKLLPELSRYTEMQSPVGRLFPMLRRKYQATTILSRQLKTREAALLRLRTHRISSAGRVYLDQRGGDDRTELERLDACEDWRWPLEFALPSWAVVDEPTQRSFDPEQIAAGLPASLGIEQGPISAAEREMTAAPAGAVKVLRVDPEGPAARAGLVTGDLIVGAPSPLSEAVSLRAWSLIWSIGQATTLEVYRHGARMQVVVVPGL